MEWKRRLELEPERVKVEYRGDLSVEEILKTILTIRRSTKSKSIHPDSIVIESESHMTLE